MLEMSPDDRAVQVHDNILCVNAGCNHCRAAISDAIRAAVSASDEQWREAVRNLRCDRCEQPEKIE
jgi:hypothetical protein